MRHVRTCTWVWTAGPITSVSAISSTACTGSAKRCPLTMSKRAEVLTGPAAELQLARIPQSDPIRVSQMRLLGRLSIDLHLANRFKEVAFRIALNSSRGAERHPRSERYRPASC